ncbi:MAG TPA: hypothetical protein VM934_01895 [Pyrinomonadaceae bacterium]|jgi:hypothetical protein|nr:hypothetical protein [Pyrinomonadaceae bacterium]
MSKKVWMKYALMASVVLASAATLFGIRAARSQNARAQDAARARAPHAEAVKQGGLREAAKVTGRYARVFDNPVWKQAADVKDLAARSSAVVVGTPSKNVSRLSADGQMITIEYQVTIQEVIKGKLKAGRDVTVSLPGGMVMFEDGTSAKVRTPGFRKMVNGQSYALFLVEDEKESAAMTPTSGPQGIFELPADGSGIRHYGRSLTLAPDDSAAPAVETFLEKIRKAAK